MTSTKTKTFKLMVQQSAPSNVDALAWPSAASGAPEPSPASTEFSGPGEPSSTPPPSVPIDAAPAAEPTAARTPPAPAAIDPANERGIFGLGRALKSARRALHWDKPDPAPQPPAAATRAEPAESAQPASVTSTPKEIPAGLCGHTSTVAMPEVLGFLSQLRKSGTLWIWNDREQFRVQMLEGQVTYARSESPRQGSLLGEILVAQGAVDAARFDAYMNGPRPEGPLGDALVQAGLVTPQALSAAVQYQAQRVFNRAYGIEDAYFRFDARSGEGSPKGIRLSVTHMLFESARSRDESAARLDSVLGDPFTK